jgi:hypothetical protein
MNPSARFAASNRRIRTNDWESTMKRYQPGTPRALGAAAAALMTVATLAVAVIVPAGADKSSDAIAPSAQTAATSGDTCVTTRIDVIAVRVPPAQRAANAGTERVNS